MKRGRAWGLLTACVLVCTLLVALLPANVFAAGFSVSTPSLTLKLGQKGTLNVKADQAAGRIDWSSEGAVSAKGSAWVENGTQEITVVASGVGDGRVTITLSDAATFDGEPISNTYTADFYVESVRQMVYGMKGSDVIVLQERLNSLGYNVGEVDGYYGRMTENAVKAFQEASGLYVDGEVGPLTMDALMTYELLPEEDPQMRRLSYGSTGEDVYEMQVALEELGYPVGGADGIFGFMTETAVKQFQQKNGLIVDGVAGPQTQEQIFADDAVPASGSSWGSRTLEIGMSGDDVYQLQVLLMNAGYLGGGADSIFGPATENAVKSYQRDHGLYVDGIVGPKTRAALDSGSGGGTIDRVLSYGMTGDDVLLLQKTLASLGYYQGDWDSAYGAYTEAAVIEFQQDYGLSADGVAGPITLAKLGLW